MTRRWTVLAAVAALAFAAGCAKAPPGTEDAAAAYDQLRDSYMASESPAEKARLARNFIEEFPDDERTPGIADAYIYHLAHELDQPQEAFDVVAAVRRRAGDPEVRFGLGMLLVDLADEAGRQMALTDVVDELSEHRELRYSERLDVIQAAVDLGSWELAVDQGNAALEQATPEAYLADYPDRDFTEEEARDRARRRQALVLAPLGWAQYHLGDVEEALATFHEAKPLTDTNYVGLPETPLYTYWGQVELAEGNPELAAELLAPDGIMGHREEALEALREAHAAIVREGETFDEWMWAERQRLARQVDDFTLPRYDGSELQLASLDDTVVLLAFWFPT